MSQKDNQPRLTHSEIVRLLRDDFNGNADRVRHFIREVADEFTIDEAFGAVIALVDTPDVFS